MKLIYDIPASFWGLFRSVNRDIYIEALLTINDEYQYNNYFLSREACVQILSDMCSSRRYAFMREDNETEEDEETTLPGRILNWLVRTKWLRKIEDYEAMTTNIVIPDYAAVMIEAFEKLADEPLDDTDLYIQNVYATLFSFKNDHRMNLTMLKTALVNTKKLNKALQDMLHNMDKFFERLLNKQSYDELLKEHLEGYVEEVVRRKYHILKTSDNFYIYKTDIRRCLRELREDDERIELIRKKEAAKREHTKENGKEDNYYKNQRSEDVLDLIDQIERGFEDIEHRIANMDKEHSKYVRATVTRLNYLLSEESDRKGLLISLLNQLRESDDTDGNEKKIEEIARHMNLSAYEVLSENPLFKRRRRKKFADELAADDAEEELSKEDILKINRIMHRFSKEEVISFLEEHMTGDTCYTEDLHLSGDAEFEKLILAYDLAMRKNSPFEVMVEERTVTDGRYSYPVMTFVRNKGKDIRNV